MSRHRSFIPQSDAIVGELEWLIRSGMTLKQIIAAMRTQGIYLHVSIDFGQTENADTSGDPTILVTNLDLAFQELRQSRRVP